MTDSQTPPDETGPVAGVRFALVGELPLLAVDLAPTDDDEGTPDLLRDSLFRLLVERGMVVLPRFYGVDLPRGVRVGCTLEPTVLRLEDHEETTLLRVPAGSVDADWRTRALALQGTMLCVGPALGIAPGQTPHEVCDLLDLAASAGRVAGAIVGVAETRTSLPLLW